jgi:SAM-dependent methyltransferase
MRKNKLTTFSTGEEQFEADYRDKAILQNKANTELIDDLVLYVQQRFSNSEPLKIADFCCGDGAATNYLRICLEELGYKISIIGYDISAEQIKVATTTFGNSSELRFQIHDVAKPLQEGEFDVIFSLFGLHWLDEIKLPLALDHIHHALKPEGTLMFLVPLEKEGLYAKRKELVESSHWRAHFGNYKMLPFFSKPQQYLACTEKHFRIVDPEDSGERKVVGMAVPGSDMVFFEIDKFKRFLSSWIQEIRHLEGDEVRGKYLDELLAKLKKSGSESALPLKGTYPNCEDVEITPKNTVQFCERFFWFYGVNTKDKTAAHKSTPASAGVKL